MTVWPSGAITHIMPVSSITHVSVMALVAGPL